MNYTCAVVFYRDGKILLGHATNQKHWDLPKGKMEQGETPKQAAARECYEEIGYEIHEDSLHLIGEVPYVRGKRLVLFYCTAPKPEISELSCKSTFIDHKGRECFEMDAYKYVPLNELPQYCTERMCSSIIDAVRTFYKEREHASKNLRT